MRNWYGITGVLLVVALLAAVPAAAANRSCSCDAPDGSCSASVSCSGNSCIAICSPGGGCYAECFDYVTTPPQLELRKKPVSLEGRSLEAWRAQDALEQLTGLAVRFSAAHAGDTVSFQAENLPASEVIEAFARVGAVAVFEAAPDEAGAWRTAAVSMKLREASGADLRRILSEVLGREVGFWPASSEGTINLSARGVRGADLVAYLARLGELTVAGEAIVPAPER